MSDMTTSTFVAKGMHCPSCSMLITMNVEDLPGVTAVRCDHATGMTSVIHDAAATDAATIRKAIEDSGYEAVETTEKGGRR